ncbi:FAD/FMN-containing dehydrogenase [Diaminobutyricimonas aerilata]|uniref:FAD/FMN-containing dehydrogenase n=1 Tax=Diaminobutyricimonas aerilata TaxID=1162967 RepID=A0A2M9CNL5_9MICO|nr:FAD-binding oxidoreductase [Diaminobutyricimonas aerilata]PJJ73482.1 FAD/FMN-containing dehydrogenase [Diaminobutyricimonas aerilata]
MSITSALSANLSDALRGRVWTPEHDEFEKRSRPWNLAIAQQPAAVVEAADADDVATLVRVADSAGLAVSTQPNGHGASGRVDDTILLRTGRLDGISVDPVARRAVIGAGVRSGDLQRAVAEHGLTALPGSSPVVSVTGVALGGGLSWFGRAHGWVADSVTAFDVVDAHGRRLHATPDEHPDLYWALRGGGGDYAIVTALEIALHPAPHVFGGRMSWTGEHTRAVAEAFRALTSTAPEELTAWLTMLQFPGAEPLVALDVTYLGTEVDARRLLSSLDALPAPASDTRRAMSVAELGSITGEPTAPGPGASHAELITALDDAALDALVSEPIAPLLSVQVRHLGGAFARPSDSPHGALGEPYALYMFGLPLGEEAARAIRAKQAALAAALPTSGRKPVTFLDPTERLSDALPPESIERLRRIKREYDPRGLIRANFTSLE